MNSVPIKVKRQNQLNAVPLLYPMRINDKTFYLIGSYSLRFNYDYVLVIFGKMVAINQKPWLARSRNYNSTTKLIQSLAWDNNNNKRHKKNIILAIVTLKHWHILIYFCVDRIGTWLWCRYRWFLCQIFWHNNNIPWIWYAQWFRKFCVWLFLLPHVKIHCECWYIYFQVSFAHSY